MTLGDLYHAALAAAALVAVLSIGFAALGVAADLTERGLIRARNRNRRKQ